MEVKTNRGLLAPWNFAQTALCGLVFYSVALHGQAAPPPGGLLPTVAFPERHVQAEQHKAVAAPRVAIALPDADRVLRDLAYGPEPSQRLDVYLPAHASSAPVLFLVHGGAWVTGDKSGPQLVDNKLAHWLPKGVVVVSVNYRLLPQAKPDVQAADVVLAPAWAQQHAASWGADPRRFVLMGHSSGAHLVALLAGNAQALRAAGAQDIQAAVVIDTAAIDVARLMAQKPRPPQYDRAFGSVASDWTRVSPRAQLRSGAPPLLVVCSSLRVGVCERAQQYVEAARALGGQAEVLEQALRHLPVNERLGLPGDYTDAVDDFLARNASW